MKIQDEIAKIHHKFGVSEKANYEIQLFIDEYANQRVIDELEKILKDKYDAYSDPEIYDHPENFVIDAEDLELRIKELKK